MLVSTSNFLNLPFMCVFFSLIVNPLGPVTAAHTCTSLGQSTGAKTSDQCPYPKNGVILSPATIHGQ